MPAAMGHQETYRQNQDYTDFLEQWDLGFYAKYIDALMPPRSGARVLDVGCGVGKVVGRLTEAGFVLKEGDTPIVPVMLFNAKLAQDFSRALYDEGIYAVGFFFPVVPQSQARIRTQISAGHETHHLDRALEAFIKVGRKFDILGKTKKEIIDKYGS